MKKALRNQEGAIFALLGLVLFLLAALIGLATDFGVMAYVKNQGQSAVDTAALAAASALPEYREDGDPSLAMSRVAALDAANDVRGDPADVASAALEFLEYDPATDTFVCESDCDLDEVNAVRVTKTDYQAPFFFSWARNAFGASAPGSIDVAVSATAHLGCSSGIDTDGGIGPIALRECEIDYPDDCNVGRMLQSEADNTAFTTFNLKGSSVCSQIAKLTPPANLQETVRIGDVINLVGTGQATSCLQEIDERFDHCTAASCDEPADPTCLLPLPVIDCAGPESDGIVVGFATACVTQVEVGGKEGKYIRGEIQCNETDPGGPGGQCFGTFAQRPVLVR